MLKRFFLIPTSQSTVHKTLSEKGLVNKARRKPVKNPPKPRFFERSRPNQLWQSDSGDESGEVAEKPFFNFFFLLGGNHQRSLVNKRAVFINSKAIHHQVIYVAKCTYW
ncbi:hypothetical protein DSCW_03980 [Desulfosarcina widdelii]|uniref:Uncharacterized protein n=1 Tax=Desulfosarcina widdelii TaxID=947919 RepID=A0A5K7Z0L1_9BACT|nr:hypothetical protein DSCW_03980 [Desulfosarcina widdelii]